MVLKSFTDPCNDSTPFKASSTLIRTHWPYSRSWLSAPPVFSCLSSVWQPPLNASAPRTTIIHLCATVNGKRHHEMCHMTPCAFTVALSQKSYACVIYFRVPHCGLSAEMTNHPSFFSFFLFFSFLMTWCQKGILNYLESAWFAFQ